MLLFAISLSFAQEKADTKPAKKRVFPKFSFQLQVNDLFQFTDFQGGTISMKYHFTDQNALRLGVGISTYKNERSDDQILMPDSLLQTDKRTQNRYLTTIFSQYIIYPRTTDEIKLYFGAGPFIRWFDDEVSMNRLIPWQNVDATSGQTEISEFSFGFGFVIGAEWFFMDQMSLILDYGLSIYHTERVQKTTNHNVYQPGEGTINKRTENLSGIQSDMVKIGLSIYL